MPHALGMLGRFLWLSHCTRCAGHAGAFLVAFPPLPVAPLGMMGCFLWLSHHAWCAVHDGMFLTAFSHCVLCMLGHFLWLSHHTLCAAHDGIFSHGFPTEPCALCMMGHSPRFSHHSLCAVHAGTFCYSSVMVSSAPSADHFDGVSLCRLLLRLSGLPVGLLCGFSASTPLPNTPGPWGSAFSTFILWVSIL